MKQTGSLKTCYNLCDFLSCFLPTQKPLLERGLLLKERILYKVPKTLLSAYSLFYNFLYKNMTRSRGAQAGPLFVEGNISSTIAGSQIWCLCWSLLCLVTLKGSLASMQILYAKYYLAPHFSPLISAVSLPPWRELQRPWLDCTYTRDDQVIRCLHTQ